MPDKIFIDKSRMSCDNSKSKRLTGSLRGNGRAHGKNGATINDVAKRVGVTKVTVSYMLNGR